MRTFRLALPLLALFAASSCQSTSTSEWCEACQGTQALVERVAAENPSVTRLTVHCTPANGGTAMACASTSSAKRGKPSDPEDLRAMQSGETVVLEEGSALDVTVPAMQAGGTYKGAIGVTLATDGMTREQVVAKAKTIAMSVENGVKGAGACTCDCCGKAK